MVKPMEYVLLLDLKDDPVLIAEYEDYHRDVWASVKSHLRQNGVIDMRIYRLATRLVMVLETTADFSFTVLAKNAEKNPAVTEWECLMSHFQQPLPQAGPDEKWLQATPIFSLK